jgi:hypothetical protein
VGLREQSLIILLLLQDLEKGGGRVFNLHRTAESGCPVTGRELFVNGPLKIIVFL